MTGYGEMIVIGGRNLLRDYNTLRAKGYVRVWAGEGRMGMQLPLNPVSVPIVPIVEVLADEGKESE